MPSKPTADTISLSETIALLDNDFSALAEALLNRRFALWVGSGISFGRAPSLGRLISLAVEHIRAQLTTNDDDDRFGIALKKILNLAGLSEDELTTIPYAQSFSLWPPNEKIVVALWPKYSSMLDVRIKGEDDDYLLWRAVDVRTEYGFLSDPDSEHLAIAILILEGAVSKIASANWDGLIEAAVDQLSPEGRAGILQVVVDPNDVRDAAGQAVLVKFHGCAVLAVADPVAYRKFLIGAKSQITNWPNEQDLEALRIEVQQIATSYRALMVGLSLQDTNLQDIFSKARMALPWIWPCGIGDQAHIFCEEKLGEAQEAMLRVVYGKYYGPNEDDILAKSRLRAYGKFSLLALALQIVTIKLRVVLEKTVEGKLSREDALLLGDGLLELRNMVAATAPSADDKTLTAPYLRLLIWEWSRLIALFRRGETPPIGSLHYHMISPLPVSSLLGDQNVADARLGELAVALALLGRHASVRKISLRKAAGEDVTHGALDGLGAWPGAQSTQVYFAQGPYAVLKLIDQGALAGTSIVVLHCDDSWRQIMRTSSRGSPKGGLPSEANKVRHVSIPNLLSSSGDLADLEQRFLEEVTL